MKKKLLQEAADNVWDWWEENEADDEYPGEGSKVCAFADFVEELAKDEESLLSIAKINTNHDYVARALYKFMMKGIDAYLGNPFDDMMKALKKSQGDIK